MIAKRNGTCPVTGQPIVAGVTEIENIGGVWQVKGAGKYADRLVHVTTAMVLCTIEHPSKGTMRVLKPRHIMLDTDMAWNCVVSVENDSRPKWRDDPENGLGELDRQWEIDGGR